MAVVNFYVQADMSNPTFWYGSITGYTSTSISLSDGVRSGTYSGSFNYSSETALSNSIITGYAGYSNGQLSSRVSGLSVYRVRGGRSLRLPTEPCVRIRTRLLMQGVSIEKHQTNALTFDQSVFPALSG